VEDCDSRFAIPQDRHSHCIEDHQFPHDFRFDNARKHKTKRCELKLTIGGKVDSAMEVDTNSGDSKCVTSVNRPKSKPEPEAVLPQAFEEFPMGLTRNVCRNMKQDPCWENPHVPHKREVLYLQKDLINHLVLSEDRADVGD
jgi:hypothetical protein